MTWTFVEIYDAGKWYHEVNLHNKTPIGTLEEPMSKIKKNLVVSKIAQVRQPAVRRKRSELGSWISF